MSQWLSQTRKMNRHYQSAIKTIPTDILTYFNGIVRGGVKYYWPMKMYQKGSDFNDKVGSISAGFSQTVNLWNKYITDAPLFGWLDNSDSNYPYTYNVVYLDSRGEHPVYETLRLTKYDYNQYGDGNNKWTIRSATWTEYTARIQAIKVGQNLEEERICLDDDDGYIAGFTDDNISDFVAGVMVPVFSVYGLMQYKYKTAEEAPAWLHNFDNNGREEARRFWSKKCVKDIGIKKTDTLIFCKSPGGTYTTPGVWDGYARPNDAQTFNNLNEELAWRGFGYQSGGGSDYVQQCRTPHIRWATNNPIYKKDGQSIFVQANGRYPSGFFSGIGDIDIICYNAFTDGYIVGSNQTGTQPIPWGVGRVIVFDKVQFIKDFVLCTRWDNYKQPTNV